MARQSLTAKVTAKGPFFAQDPQKTWHQNVQQMMDGIAAEGERAVVALLRAGQGGRRPLSFSSDSRVADYVVGRTRSQNGKRWAVTAVISPSTKTLTAHHEYGLVLRAGRIRSVRTRSYGPAVALMAAGSEIETQTGVFRKVTAVLRRAKSVNVTELLRGLT